MSMQAWVRLCVLAGSPGDPDTEFSGLSIYKPALNPANTCTAHIFCTGGLIPATSARYRAGDDRIQITSPGQCPEGAPVARCQT